MRVIIACETSGNSRRAFAALGHEVISCDLLPADDGCAWDCKDPKLGRHWQGDIRDFFRIHDPRSFDLMIAHPDCTYLTVSGLHWNKRGVLVNGVPRAELTEQSLQFVKWLMFLPIPHIAIENPVGCISTRIMKPTQIIQPYEFGHDASKKTCLWLFRLPKLIIDQTMRYPGRLVNDNGKMVERWSNQTDSGQNKLPPSEDRWKLRSETYPNISRAMAIRWSMAPLETTIMRYWLG